MRLPFVFADTDYFKEEDRKRSLSCCLLAKLVVQGNVSGDFISYE